MMHPVNDNDSRAEQSRRQTIENACAAIWLAALIVGGYWLLAAFTANQREQECIAHGYRMCLEREIATIR